jgi:hypothetical protein
MKYSTYLSFEGGALRVNKSGFGEDDGSGELSFRDVDLEYDYPDGGSSSTYQLIKIPKSELEAIRDFLVKELGE